MKDDETDPPIHIPTLVVPEEHRVLLYDHRGRPLVRRAGFTGRLEPSLDLEARIAYNGATK
jgi:hypothetical protein